MKDYYMLTTEQTFNSVESSDQGLSTKEAQRRLDRDGPNVLPSGKKLNIFEAFFKQFKNIVIWVLIGAAIVSYLLSHMLEMWAILFIVLITVFLSFFQEYSADRTMQAIAKLTAANARVLRDGKIVTLPINDLVVGDVIIAKTNNASITDPGDWIILKTKRGEATTNSLGLVKYANQTAVDAALADDVVVRPSVLKAKVDTSGDTYTKTFGTDIVKKYVTLIGNNSSLSITVTHSLGTEDVAVTLLDATSKDTIWADVTRSSANAISVSFSSPPASNSIKVIVTA